MVEDREARAETERFRFGADEAHSEAVKGREPDRLGRLGAHGLSDALPHLVGRLVGERDRQKRSGGNAGGQKAPDARRDHAGLARTGARQHQERPLPVLDRGTLLSIQSQGSWG